MHFAVQCCVDGLLCCCEDEDVLLAVLSAVLCVVWMSEYVLHAAWRCVNELCYARCENGRYAVL